MLSELSWQMELLVDKEPRISHKEELLLWVVFPSFSSTQPPGARRASPLGAELASGLEDPGKLISKKTKLWNEQGTEMATGSHFFHPEPNSINPFDIHIISIPIFTLICS